MRGHVCHPTALTRRFAPPSPASGRGHAGALLFALVLVAVSAHATTYRNPVLFADFSDPDVIRVGDDYYLTASSFQAVPALPILHSRDLVSWTIIGYAAERLPSPDFDRPQHGNGIWAPTLRHHDGYFWIYVGDPDRGIYMTRARDPRGPWEPLTLVQAAKGWIDPAPFWDDDGSMYLVHAWAKSRAGFNGVLTMRRLSADGRRVIGEGTVVFDGRERHPTIEGPKLYKRNGWYYIFAPAGGVKRGWQTVLRSKNILGPYEDKVVLRQGATQINGPHQGAWVEAADGSSWFVHFQDRGAYGRIVHLQPMKWVNDWPVIGDDGQPVLAHFAPASRGASPALQTSDEFDGDRLGLQWQWHGNPRAEWAAVSRGRLRLRAVPPQCLLPRDSGGEGGRRPDEGARSDRVALTRRFAPPSPASGRGHGCNLWPATNLLLQKFSGPAFVASTRLDPAGLKDGERAGLVVMGADYATLVVRRSGKQLAVSRTTARDADQGSPEVELASIPVARAPLHLRVRVSPEAVARFSWSADGRDFQPIGTAFVARPGRWIGAKVGLFAGGDGGYADFDWFRVEPTKVDEAASLIVAQDGSGDFTTIQEALDAIPRDNEDNRTILIRNGTYREKVRITKSYVSLIGEDRERTRLEFAELRRNWRAVNPDDFGAAVINIAPGVTDVVIANLLVHNNYGRLHGDHDHQFAIRSMEGSNRIAVLDATVVADGGDTFSPWNAESGLTYASDSYFEGWVDFVCPRGWAYITNSRFFSHSTTASIWHDGSRDKDQKFVIRRSAFDGIPGFALGRNHRDAQFYLVDVDFSSNMADRPIYPAKAPDPRQWGERYYYANARRDGGDFAWFADNLHEADGSPRVDDVTATWTFDGRWDPATLPSVLPVAAIPRPENGARVSPSGVTLRWTPSRNTTSERIAFGTVIPSEARNLGGGQNEFPTGPLEPGETYYWRVDSVTPTGVVPGKVWSFTADAREIRIVLVGDSTVTKHAGWGAGFESHVAESAAVINLARGGRSSKSFIDEGSWAAALAERPTHVLIQFGHNDQPGKGADRETDLPTFRANLARYIDEARAVGAKPVLVTSLVRRNFTPEGRIRSDLTPWADAAREVAAAKGVPLIDLHAKSIEVLERVGLPASVAISPVKTNGTLDRTHLNEEGSALFGAVVANELRRVVPDLAPHIRAATIPDVQGAWSVRMADSVMARNPDPMWIDATTRPRWEYTPGLVLKSIMHVAERTGDQRYWKYVETYYDGMISDDGTIENYKLEDYNIDRINPGKPLFTLFERTKNPKYRKAIERLRQQMREHPRTSEGGFWHKKRYPHQMWLDGLYMGAPFLAQYAKEFGEPKLFDDVIHQFVLMEKHARDEKTGLLYHGWDESRQQKWADPKTGRSPAFWGRAMGWYAMGLVEALDFIPLDHPRRHELIGILQRLAEAITRVQDAKTGVWWQVLDQGGREGNYREASVSVMFTFTLLKASRLGYIDPKYAEVGRRAYEGILREFIEVDDKRLVNIHRVCQVAGLGPDPGKDRYRSGTFEYYISEPIVSNDPKAVGPFIFASLEMELR